MNLTRLPVLRHGMMLRHEDLLPDKAMTERIDKVRQLMAAKSVEALMVFSDAATSGPVCYLTHYPCYGLGRRAVAVLGSKEGPFLYTGEPARNLPRVRRFTTCELEKARRFLPSGCETARKLSPKGTVGLVNFANLAVELVSAADKGLEGLGLKDLTREYSALMAGRDQGSLQSTKRALGRAQQGLTFFLEEARSEKDLWAWAAQTDYRLRLLGCEDTNILLGCGSGGRVRPGYPSRVQPRPGDTLVAYIGVQYARHWGVVGRTISVGPAKADLNSRLAKIEEVQKALASKIRSGMTLKQAKDAILQTGEQAGLSFAQDLPLVTGIGFDPSEYPTDAEDRIENDSVLQVALAVDSKDFTAMRIDMLQVSPSGGTWLEAG